MNSNDALKEIQALLGRMGKRNVTLDTDLTKESILDSIEMIDFIVAIQKRFGIKISEREIFSKELYKIANMVAFLSTVDQKDK